MPLQDQDSPRRAEASQPARALTRRTFLESVLGMGLLPGGAALGVVACGGAGDSNVAGAPASAAAPAADLVVVENASTLAMAVEERQVQWVIGKSPAKPMPGSCRRRRRTPPSGVLGNGLGPFFNVRRDSACTVTWTNTIGASTPAAGPPADRRSTSRSISACAAGS